MLAFSYIRWSSTQQTSGDSLRRQTDLAASYAAQHNLTLDNTSFQDHGVSAFKGKNVVEGKLGTFLQAIDEGTIETPCYLLVEALDRITRNEIADATQLFLSIIQRGVTIVVLQSEQLFSKETISADNGISLIIAISMLVQGYTDSAKRGKRVGEAWDQKRQKMTEGVIASRHCPSWLDVSEDGTRFIVNEEKAAIVRRMFSLAFAGNGVHSIAKIFNAEGVPTISKRRQRNDHGELTEPTQVWTPGNISGFFRHECVFGRWRRASKRRSDGPECIDNYYPEIVSKEDYDAIAVSRSKRTANGGFRQGTSNLFSGLTKCAYCDTALKFKGLDAARPKAKATNKSVYLHCRRAMVHACTADKIPYMPLESDLLSYLINWQNRDLNPQQMASNTRSVRSTLEQELALRESELDALVKVITLTKSSPEVLAARIDDVQSQIDKLKDDIKKLTATNLTEQQLKDSVELFEQLVDGGDQELRKKVQVALRRQIRKIEIAPNIEKHQEVHSEFGLQLRSKEPLHMVKLTYIDGSTATTDIIVGD